MLPQITRRELLKTGAVLGSGLLFDTTQMLGTAQTAVAKTNITKAETNKMTKLKSPIALN